jgi:hypothetical protein
VGEGGTAGVAVFLAVEEGAVFHEDAGTDSAFAFGVDVAGEGAGPGDVAVAGEVERVLGFAEGPFVAGKNFAEGKEVRGDVRLIGGEPFLGGGELVHEGETEVVFFGGEADREEAAGEILGRLPADLPAETAGVAGGFKVGQVPEKEIEDGADEVPMGPSPPSAHGGHLRSFAHNITQSASATRDMLICLLTT